MIILQEALEMSELAGTSDYLSDYRLRCAERSAEAEYETAPRKVIYSIYIRIIL